MGTANGREEGATDTQSAFDDSAAAQVSMADQDAAHGPDYMGGHSPPSSPRASQSPLMFRPQMPVVPLQRPDELNIPSPSWMQTSSVYEDASNEQGIPTMITWSYGGKEVSVEGSWDSWKSRKPLQRSGKDFTIMKVLPSGVYQYRFLVDGQWRHSPDQPWDQDDSGNAYNVLDLQLRKNDKTAPAAAAAAAPPTMSKNAQKRLLKQQRFEAKKAEKKAQMKEHKLREAERKRKEWEDKLASLDGEEREKLIEQRRGLRRERMEQRSEEKGQKKERLQHARVIGQNVVIDLEFAHLMSPTELSSLVQQIMYCYAINGRCALPAHIWLTGCNGEMQNQLMRIPGYDKWVIEKEDQSYIESFQDRKENLVYLTADSENVLDELDPKSIYIIGGLVDRNRWKGLTMNKANEQGIKTAKLPIGSYLKMSSSQVLTVNQVIEILLRFLESKDWKKSFFQVIPLRKRGEAGSEDNAKEVERNDTCDEDDTKMPGTDNKDDEDGQSIPNLEGEDCVGTGDQKAKRQCIDAQIQA